MAIIPPVQRIEALETTVKMLVRELAELREEQQVSHGLCEMRYDRLLQQRDGTFVPRLGGSADKTAREPISTAALGSRNGYSE